MGKTWAPAHDDSLMKGSLVESSFLFYCLKTLGVWNISRHEIKQQLEVILVFFFSIFCSLKKTQGPAHSSQGEITRPQQGVPYYSPAIFILHTELYINFIWKYAFFKSL